MINFKKHILPNGTRLIVSPNDQTEAVTVLILVGVGGRYENDRQKGISHFLEHLFFKGSKNRPSAFEISRELDSIGANYNAFTGEEYTGFYVQSSRKDADRAFGVISDMFLNPLFDGQEIEREKGVIIQEANMYHDMPQAYVQVINQKQMFGDHPLGFDLVGDPDNIKATTREDIVAYHDQGYLPERTIVAVCGNIENLNLQEKISELFSRQLSEKNEAPLAFQKEKVDNRLKEEVRDVDQAHLVISYLSPSKTDERRYALSLLNTIMGAGMSSRLFTQIRERRGLAYYVRSSTTGFLDTGMFSISAGVKPDSLAETVKITTQEISDLLSNGPSSEELERAKGNLRGSLAISMEDSLEIASFGAEDMLYFDRIRSLQEIIEKVEQVQKQDIIDIAKEVFNQERMGISIIGPKSYREELGY